MANYGYMSDPYKKYGSPKKKPDYFILVVIFLTLLLIIKNLFQ